MLVLDSEGRIAWTKKEASQKGASVRATDLAREITTNTDSVAPDAGRDTSNILAQMGRPLASEEVQRRLRLCNPRLVFERSIRYPELTGIYVMTWERNASGGWDYNKKHFCGMESGIMPEFTVLHRTEKPVANPELFGTEKPVDAVDWLKVPTYAGETRGWRTVLIRLLKANLVSRGQVETHFGWLPSKDSSKWHEHVKETIHV